MGRKLTVKEAIKLLNEKMQINPEVEGRNAYSVQTLYNMVYRGELKRYGPRHILQLDEMELVDKLVR